MSTRSRHGDRRRALALLYEADLRDGDPVALLTRGHQDTTAADRVPDDGSAQPVVAPGPFAVALVEGVAGRRTELDALITRYARGWSLERMPVVDRNLLRLGLWELTSSDVPVAVVIDEAVELANELSTPDSGRFVNGVLAAVARDEPQVAAARAAANGDAAAAGAPADAE